MDASPCTRRECGVRSQTKKRTRSVAGLCPTVARLTASEHKCTQGHRQPANQSTHPPLGMTHSSWGDAHSSVSKKNKAYLTPLSSRVTPCKMSFSWIVTDPGGRGGTQKPLEVTNIRRP